MDRNGLAAAPLSAFVGTKKLFAPISLDRLAPMKKVLSGSMEPTGPLDLALTARAQMVSSVV